MSLEKELLARSSSNCELCGANGSLLIFDVLPQTGIGVNEKLHLCKTCVNQIENPENIQPAYSPAGS